MAIVLIIMLLLLLIIEVYEWLFCACRNNDSWGSCDGQWSFVSAVIAVEFSWHGLP